jgi:DNA-binding transcriptional ArsR family regulator
MATRISGELPNIIKISRLFKVLGNPKRLQLIYLLIQRSMSVSEISSTLNWEQSGVSHQLQLLRKYNLVQQHRHGKVVIYHLDDPKVMTLIADALSHAEDIVK